MLIWLLCMAPLSLQLACSVQALHQNLASASCTETVVPSSFSADLALGKHHAASGQGTYCEQQARS